MSAMATRQRILDVAEKQFADQGYAGASLRAIISAAKVNLAAVHYHFRSKEALLEAVLLRRAGPLNEERLRLLNAIDAGGLSPEAVDKIIEAFIGPPMRLVLDGRGEGRIFATLVGRLYAETSERLFHMIKRHFAPVSMRFLHSLHETCPHLSKEEVFWRFHCVAGTMAHTLAHWDHLEIVSARPIKPKNIDAVMAELVRFLAAGFRAPSGSERPKARKRGKRG
jgi:AcrR family transcriptional regulator